MPTQWKVQIKSSEVVSDFVNFWMDVEGPQKPILDIKLNLYKIFFL